VQGGLQVKTERRRQVSVYVDLRPQIGDLLLRSSNGIGTGNEAAWRPPLGGDCEERDREPDRIAGRLPVLRPPEFELRRSA
jgi:hypothetical protein